MRPGRPSLLWLCCLFASLELLSLSCRSGETPSRAPGEKGAGRGIPGGPAGRLRVVCTTTIVADLVRQVGGTDVEVISLMGPGVDPHGYRASSEDVRRLAEADLVFASGLGLEAKMEDALADASRRQRVIVLAESIHPTYLRPDPGAPGRYDPHVWLDPALWLRELWVVEKTLAEADTARAQLFRDRGYSMRGDLSVLMPEIDRMINAAGPEPRTLVTAHDGFGYLARLFRWEAVGLDGLTTARGHRDKDIARVSDLVLGRHIPAAFAESTVPRSGLEEVRARCVAAGGTLEIAGPLFGDALDSPGTPAGTYQGALRHNVQTIVQALP